MGRFDFVSPGAAMAGGLHDYLIERELQRRQDVKEAEDKQRMALEQARSGREDVASKNKAALDAVNLQNVNETLARNTRNDVKAQVEDMPGQPVTGDLAEQAKKLVPGLVSVDPAQTRTTLPASTISAPFAVSGAPTEPTPPVKTPLPQETYDTPETVTSKGSTAHQSMVALGEDLKNVTDRKEATRMALARGVAPKDVDDVLNAYMGKAATADKHSPEWQEYQDYVTSLGPHPATPVKSFEQYMNDDANRKKPNSEAQANADNNRLDRSYTFNRTELNKSRDKMEENVTRLTRLRDTVGMNSPQADALIAPELLTVMAGGVGSGVRMNEAEIGRIVGGRDHWQSLQAALNKWVPGGALSVTETQRKEIMDLVNAVMDKARKKADLYTGAGKDLTNARTVDDHRRVMDKLSTDVNALDFAENTVPKGGDGTTPATTTPAGTAPASVQKWGRDAAGNPIPLK